MHGPQLAFSDELHAQKHRGKGETFRDAMSRIASGSTDDDRHYKEFREILLRQAFLPAGRVQLAMGSLKDITPYNCFVSGVLEDSLVDGHGSIMQRVLEAAATMRMGGGIGYDFSTLRPFKDLIHSQQTYASGPISFMNVFDATCKTIASAGQRRGAQMSVLRIDHPDIELFINAKHPTAEKRVLWELVESISDKDLRARAAQALQSTLPLTAFNMSIAVTDEFMECLKEDRPFKLQFGGRVYREVNPRSLWDMVMRSTWDWAEPGVLFIDTINKMNNLYYCETISATNPCGEQPLPPYGACLLGSINLVKYLRKEGTRWVFEWDQLGADIPVIIRAMDNVVDRAKYPMYEQKKEAQGKRRMGIGVTGLANCLEALGMPYGSPKFLKTEAAILERLCNDAYIASAKLAAEKGQFPMYDKRLYGSGRFISGLRDDVKELISRHGMRNSHLISIAPTGTISLTADNITSGIEPVIDYSFKRDVLTADGPRRESIQDYGARVLGVRGVRSQDVTVQQHLDVLATAYRHVDSAVSKTCNVPGSTSWSEFKDLYVQAWERGCKGCTTFRMDGKRTGIFTVSEDDTQPDPDEQVYEASGVEERPSACYVDEATGRRECE